MVLNPDVQIKAQEEIDRVVGSGRLPTLDDQDSLPYVNSVVKEAWRWHMILPLGFAHSSTEDDYVRGYFIPKGAIVMANVQYVQASDYRSDRQTLNLADNTNPIGVTDGSPTIRLFIQTHRSLTHYDI
jgi:hypothetical protein